MEAWVKTKWHCLIEKWIDNTATQIRELSERKRSEWSNKGRVGIIICQCTSSQKRKKRDFQVEIGSRENVKPEKKLMIRMKKEQNHK